MKKELTPLVLLILSIIVFGLVSTLGIVYNLFKCIYECVKLKPVVGLYHFVGYWLKVLYQLWNVAKYLFMKVAIAIDLFGNMAGGEMIEDCVTAKEDTLYGRGDSTVSSATGKLELENDLNKTGIWFTNLLSTVLGKNHSTDAYKKELTGM